MLFQSRPRFWSFSVLVAIRVHRSVPKQNGSGASMTRTSSSVKRVVRVASPVGVGVGQVVAVALPSSTCRPPVYVAAVWKVPSRKAPLRISTASIHFGRGDFQDYGDK